MIEIRNLARMILERMVNTTVSVFVIQEECSTQHVQYADDRQQQMDAVRFQQRNYYSSKNF